MKKTIVIVCSCDTKYREAAFIRERVEAEGLQALVVDVATGPGPSYGYDIPREEVAEAAGTRWEELEGKTKGEKIAFMRGAVTLLVSRLYREGNWMEY